MRSKRAELVAQIQAAAGLAAADKAELAQLMHAVWDTIALTWQCHVEDFSLWQMTDGYGGRPSPFQWMHQQQRDAGQEGTGNREGGGPGRFFATQRSATKASPVGAWVTFFSFWAS
jgi:hypothetical protein